MKTGHDLTGHIKFLGRDDWKRHFEEVVAEHFGPPLEEFALEYDEIGEVLDDQWAMTLWGCALEDFLTRAVGADGSNIVDVYLKRRGWSEGAQGRAYMKALRNSIMSLYEVSEIVPGKSLLARDLIRGGEPVAVSEETATKMLKPWDRIAARIVPRGNGHILAGGLLPFSLEASAMLIEGIRAAAGKPRARPKLSLDDHALRPAAAVFTSAWLFDVLPKAMGETLPVLHNSDGEEVVFHEIRFPLVTGVRQKDIAARLDTVRALRKENERFWNWLDSPSPKPRLARKASNAVAWNVTMDDGTLVLGHVELKAQFLILSVNSAIRAAQGADLLKGALGELVRAPLTKIQTVDQVRESRQGQDRTASDIPPEVANPHRP
jgi:hypothetical protein